ncbi:MAG: ATP synthase F1 subunit delta [Bdellovibrionales bacterium RIFOXYD1_FULL_53_11]|nr:MAG: ATP synthase F1 subunit delta [Bdellovibrionales bacterium RIFOXYD1_FULL_53_11]
MSLDLTYAKALYGVACDLSSPMDRLDRLEKELVEAAQMLADSKQLHVALVGPATSSKEKVALAEEVAKKAGFDELMRRFMIIVARKGRMSHMEDISHAFHELRLVAEGGIVGQIYATERPDTELVNKIAALLGKRINKRVSLRPVVEPRLLAGIKVTVGNISYDGSLRVHLQKLRDRIVHDIDIAK